MTATEEMLLAALRAIEASIKALGDALHARIVSHDNRHSKAQEDHETRIRVLEAFSAKAMGIIIAASVAAGFANVAISRFWK